MIASDKKKKKTALTLRVTWARSNNTFVSEISSENADWKLYLQKLNNRGFDFKRIVRSPTLQKITPKAPASSILNTGK